jgi:hypothetical protein
MTSMYAGVVGVAAAALSACDDKIEAAVVLEVVAAGGEVTRNAEA